MTVIEMLLHCMVRQMGAEAVVKKIIATEMQELAAASGDNITYPQVTDKDIRYFAAREEFKLKRRHAKRGNKGAAPTQAAETEDARRGE